MKRYSFNFGSIMSCLVLLTGTTYGFSPLYRLEKNSPVLKQLGFELRSERTRTGEVSCQVIFDEKAIDLPEWGVTIVVIGDPSEDLQTTILFESNHTLGHFTDFGSGSDGLTKRFGFQFKLGSQFIKDAFINFYMGVPKTEGGINNGDYQLRLEDFVPPDTPKMKPGSSSGPPKTPTKIEPPATAPSPARKRKDEVRALDADPR